MVTATDSLGAPEAAASSMSLGALFSRQPSAGSSSSRAEVYALKVRVVVLREGCWPVELGALLPPARGGQQQQQGGGVCA